MPHDFLKDILDHKRKVNDSKREIYAKIKQSLSQHTYTRYQIFKRKISSPGKINLIAEIKKASPSKGLLREDFDCVSIAQIYAKNGAAAVSVLTEDKYFLGRPEYIRKVSDNVDIPVLIKDFLIDEGQIYEARFLGASAILLIVMILDKETLKYFIELAHRLDLDCLVEIHNQQELNIALEVGSEIIGINNRNLQTFTVDLNTSFELISQIPKGVVIVAESGIQTSGDIIQLKEKGAHAVLIGETFMKEEDIAKKIKELMGKENDSR